MNCYLIFSVVFILSLNNVMIARFQPVSSNDDETPVTPDPILSKISKRLILVYRRLGYFKDSPHYEAAVQAVEDIAKDAVEPASLEKKLAIETHEKYIYRSLIDMEKVTMNFINQCYPPWIRRSEANLPLNEKILSTVLLNIENPRVLRLKKILIENKICESKFVKDLQRFLSMRNEKAHLELSSGERELKSISDQTVLEFLIGDKPDLSSEASDITTSKPINIEIRRSVNEIRVGFRMVVIPEYAKESDEISLTQKIQKFYDKYGSSIQTYLSESNYRPVAIFAVEGLNDAYILFENFQCAHALWERRFNLPIPDKYRNALFLSNVTEEAPLEGNFHLKIKVNSAILNKFEAKIGGLDHRGPMCRQNDEQEQRPTAIFCQFNSFEDMLLVYQYWKKEFEARIKVNEITFHVVPDFDATKETTICTGCKHKISA